MISMESKFRIFGPELGVDETFVDVEVAGLDSDNRVVVANKRGPEEWPLTENDIDQLRQQKLMLPLSRAKSHSMFNRMDDLSGEIGNLRSQMARREMCEAQRALFVAGFEEMMEDGE